MASRRSRVTRPSVTPPDPKVIYTWAFESSKARGGTKIKYVTDLYEDGTLKCNCPGWVFKKKDQPRGCKHTAQVQGEVETILQMWRDGEELPVLQESDAETGPVADSAPKTRARSKKDSDDNSQIRYGRIIEV